MFTLQWLLQVEALLLSAYLMVSMIQRQSRSNLAHSRRAEAHHRRDVDSLRARAGRYARLAHLATGERTRAFYEGRLAGLLRQAGRAEAAAAEWARTARFYDFLQR